MRAKRSIGNEILEGLKEIETWRCGKKKLKITKIKRSNYEIYSTRSSPRKNYYPA